MIHYSFQQFFTVIAILTFVYLAYVLLRFFRKEMNALFSRKGMINLQEQELDEEIFGPFENINAGAHIEQPHSEDFKKAEVIIPKIKEVIIYAGINNYDHLELYKAIKSILTSYPLVNDPVMREGITELIIHECENHGAVKPEKRELDELWELASL